MRLLLASDQCISKMASDILDNINSLAHEAQYAPGCTSSLVRMSILLQLADMSATYFPVTTVGQSSLFDGNVIVPSPHLYIEDNESDMRKIEMYLPKMKELIRELMRNRLCILSLLWVLASYSNQLPQQCSIQEIDSLEQANKILDSAGKYSLVIFVSSTVSI